MKKICVVDRVEFESKRKDALYCSPKCRQLAKRGSSSESVTNSPSEPQTDAVTGGIATAQDEPPAQKYDYEANLKAFEAMGMDKVTWLTTGIPALDELTQIPRGRVTQIQGPWAVGKTTLCLNMIRGLKGVRTLYIDTEAALNPALLAALGVEAKYFQFWNESAYVEDVYDVILRALEKPQFDLIIFDSLAACTFRTEVQGESTDANIGQKARIMNKLMRIIPTELRKTKTALVVINQEREVIGGYVPQKYTPGGSAVPYAASLIISLKTTKGARFPKTGPPFQGHEVTAEIIKSKVNTPWRKSTFSLYYGRTELEK